jgi:hypothetical protein
MLTFVKNNLKNVIYTCNTTLQLNDILKKDLHYTHIKLTIFYSRFTLLNTKILYIYKKHPEITSKNIFFTSKFNIVTKNSCITQGD